MIRGFMPIRRYLALIASTLLGALSAHGAGEDDGAAVDRWIAQLSSEDAQRRKAAIRSLGASGAEYAPRLASVIRSAGDERTRLAAFSALSLNESAYAYNYMFWEELPPADEQARKEARRTIWDGLIRVGDAFLAVGEYGAASDHYCDLLASAQDNRERALAVLGLGRASRRRAAGEVFAALSDEDPLVRSAAYAAVSQLRWGQAAPYLAKELAQSQPKRVIPLLEALSRRSGAPAVEMVRGELLNENERVASAARKARSRHLGYLTDWWLPRAEKHNETSIESLLKATEDAPELPRLEGSATQEAAGYIWRAADIDVEREASGRCVIRLPPGFHIAYSEFTLSEPAKVRFESETDTSLRTYVDGQSREGGELAPLAAGLHRIVVELPAVSESRRFSLRARDHDAKPLVLAPRIHGLPTLELR